MIRVDAHAHTFEQIAGFGPKGELRPVGEGRARWANGEEIQLIPQGLGDKSFTAETLLELMDEQGVDKAVLLQGSFYGFANEYVWQAAQKYPDRLHPAATLDPFCKQSDRLLDRYLHTMGFQIVKFELSSGGGLMGYHQDFDIAGPVMEPLFGQVAESGATLVLDIGSPGMGSFQPEAVAAVARRYPGMRVVLCHLLAPAPGDRAALQKALEALALDNVWFDLAAMPWNVHPETYPYPAAQEFLSVARSAVGSDKLLWGSDVPSTLTRENYRRQMEWVENSKVFTPSQLDGVFGGNAAAAYRL